MKKKYLSGLVILITLILATYMIVNNKGKNSDEGYIMVENSQNENTIEDSMENFLENIEKSSADNNELVKKDKKESQSEENDKSIEKDKARVENNKTDDRTEQKIEKEDIKQEEEISYIEEVDSISVFKIDKDLIMGNLTFQEKKNLTKIITSLSMNDYALIIESVKNDGELECVKKVNSILEERLDKKQYELIRDILGEYINLEIL
ncbi:MAG: hypothetical protein ACRCTZ_22330 [Sarcina sp.]